MATEGEMQQLIRECIPAADNALLRHKDFDILLAAERTEVAVSAALRFAYGNGLIVLGLPSDRPPRLLTYNPSEFPRQLKL